MSSRQRHSALYLRKKTDIWKTALTDSRDSKGHQRHLVESNLQEFDFSMQMSLHSTNIRATLNQRNGI